MDGTGKNYKVILYFLRKIIQNIFVTDRSSSILIFSV